MEDPFARTRRSLLRDYVARESNGPRIVDANEDWAAIVPFWA
jgi:galactose-1-phosphate uridylyltransferase